MGTANRVVKNTGYLYIKMAVTVFISLWTTRLILNSLGASDFGIFNIVGGAIGMLGFLNGSLASATQRFMSFHQGAGDYQKASQIFNISIALHLFMSLVVAVALIIAGWFFFNGILNIPSNREFAAVIVYISLIVSTVFTVMTVPYDATLNAHENMKYYAFVGILESFLKLAVAYVVIFSIQDKLVVYGILMAGIPLITLTIMRLYCRKQYVECKVNIRKNWDSSVAREMVKFAGWSFLGSMSSLVGNYGGGIVVNHFFGAIANAAMGIATQLNGQLLAFSNNMLKAVNPVIIKKEGAHKGNEMLFVSYLGCKYSFLLFLPFVVPVVIEAPCVLKLWLRDVPEWAILFTRMQLIRTLLEQLFTSMSTSLSAHGEIRQINTISVFNNLAPIPVLIIMFLKGCSLTWFYIVIIFFMVFLTSLSVLYYCHKLCNMKYAEYANNVLRPSIIVMAVSLMVSLMTNSIMEEGLIRLIVTIILSFVAYCTAYYFTATKFELDYLKEIKKTILSKM